MAEQEDPHTDHAASRGVLPFGLILSPHQEQALRAVMLPALGLLVCMLFGAAFGKGFLVQRACKCLSLPIIAYFYLNRPSPKVQALYAESSPTAMGWSLAGFFFAAVATSNWSPFGLLLGTVAGLFLWIRPQALWQLLASQGHSGVLVALGALSGPALIIVQRYIWKPVAEIAVAVMQLALDAQYKLSVVTKADLLQDRGLLASAKEMGMVGRHFSRANSDFIALMSGQYYMQFNVMNNALNGLFLLPFVLALLLLLREPLFRRLPLQPMLLAGIVLVLVGVPLLLSALYPLGQDGSRESASIVTAYLHQMFQLRNGAWAGMLGYLAVECALIAIMLRYFPRRETAETASQA